MSLWYLARATGAVTLVLLTLTVALGIANQRRWAPRRTPRFVVEHLHRSTSLLVIVLLVVHITASVIDGYVQIRVVDAIVPFVSAYHPLWLGLGTLAFDLLIALIVTSVLRSHIGARTWRAVHWLAYACWPVAMTHGLGIGTDAGTTGWLTVLSVGCAAVVVASVWARLTREPRPVSAPLAPTVPRAAYAGAAGRAAGFASPIGARGVVPRTAEAGSRARPASPVEVPRTGEAGGRGRPASPVDPRRPAAVGARRTASDPGRTAARPFDPDREVLR